MQKMLVASSNRVMRSDEVEHRFVKKAKEFYASVIQYLFPERQKDSRIFTKDVLVSLTAAHINFRWKDLSIELLAPFRRFLLSV